ncbi:(E)-4-hydroxy-3-methylbut-2-enyl-diphosphate synthase [Candidatus Kinetoplastibacterium blastocrithidii TCC012E]|uniref:4-hydroxy-3-methylbut-2-en-1-yl diphosphate synthase (flavodoxin) n=1 Tax=Candidatus Kinetoplastidibacterium blastocrithidiae TCC012E TaxID=1208922 RepID=M1M0M0_9PROT|nr:flavodoxin-dependent (E)-4-hydroxy-3-methylbut-2-enyl-diphosphate synthase [Candidatus Kinetoplastibacterium blastocrithidii]AGF49821.1 (E)-4-hydroxy-3-methylbut-2-enyl-diphosphate synthase [Candidatus Kinetoplastibacterium blastocrithidii TCC012E]
MSMTDPKEYYYLNRRKTNAVEVSWNDNNVTIGGGYPIVIQSMTNTGTTNYIDTSLQIKELFLSGAELVRITVNSSEAARSVIDIRNQLDKNGIYVPLVGDFHYNGHKLLSDFPDCAQALSKYRINPGNVGSGHYKDNNFNNIIEIACRYDKPVRIGVNWGSIDKDLLSLKLNENNHLKENQLDYKSVMLDTLIESALNSASHAEELGLGSNKIVISCKVSQVRELIYVYNALSDACNYPLHLGLTEAGLGDKGIVSSTSALSILLNQGIGDTIRVSITPEGNNSRSREVLIAKEILQSLGIRFYSPSVISCPGCGRTNSDFFQKLASDIDIFIKDNMLIWKDLYPGVEKMNVAVMGCVVNGPGESKNADIGISLPGNGELPIAPVFVDGERVTTLKGDSILSEFKTIISNYVAARYGRFSL